MLMLVQWMPAENKGTTSNEQMRITMPMHEPACVAPAEAAAGSSAGCRQTDKERAFGLSTSSTLQSFDETNIILLLRLQRVHKGLAVARLHCDVGTHSTICFSLVARTPTEIQCVEAAEEHLHQPQVRDGVTFVQRTPSKLHHTEIVVESVASQEERLVTS
eukprot:scaffold3572_cov125-Isochrysis_galbana.AAC.4